MAVSVVVVGAGCRGKGYMKYSLDSPDKMKCVGVAEPRKFYRDIIKKTYGLTEDQVFDDWTQLASKDRFADCAVIATPDRCHKEPALALAKKGYHIFLEKPMAVTYTDCLEIVEECKRSQVMLAIGHVLRYTPQAIKIRDLLRKGMVGEIVNIRHLEPVGFWHFAHSYVRGNWRREDETSFSLLTKSCHDLDLITYWVGQTKCTKISSFGSLKHFTSKNKPDGASSRCMDCSIEASCPYSAKKVYIEAVKRGHTGWPVSVVTEVVDIENVTKALNEGPYGRCVYECDNDVVDNQVVNMEFEDGATASFSMVAFTEKLCERQVQIFGTMGQITCDFSDPAMTVDLFDFNTRTTTKYRLIEEESQDAKQSQLKGHGGADFYAMDAFISAVKNKDPGLLLETPEDSLRSHLLCFQAEKARHDGTVIFNPEEGSHQQ